MLVEEVLGIKKRECQMLGRIHLVSCKVVQTSTFTFTFIFIFIFIFTFIFIFPTKDMIHRCNLLNICTQIQEEKCMYHLNDLASNQMNWPTHHTNSKRTWLDFITHPVIPYHC